MKTQRFAARLAAALLAACMAAPALAKSEAVPPQFPIRDFFSNPERAYFRLSEDGKTLGFMEPVDVGGGKRRLNVFVQPLDGSTPVGEPRKLTNETARDIAIYYWKGSGTILYEKDFGGDENTHVVAVDVASGKVTDLTPGEKIRAGIVDDLPDDPHHVILQHNRRNPEAFDVFRVDLRDGSETLVAQNPGDVTGWATDHAGRLRMATRSAGLQAIIQHRADETGDFKPIITVDYKTEVTPLFFTADNARFYAISNRGRDKKALVVIDPNRPEVEEVLYVHPDFDVGGANWSRALKKLTQVEWVGAKTDRKFFDDRYAKLYATLEAKLPGKEILLQARNKPEDKFIVAAYDDRSQGTRYLYDANAGTLAKLAELDKIPAHQLSPMTPIRYRSRDGLTIHGYLTLPAGREPKNLACIVNPHGGPWARDVWGTTPKCSSSRTAATACCR
jgi:dipeptidyl aminopeptidase/acylaminoacyl peptidase